MMEDIRAGKINCVLVKDLSRFGRDLSESGKYIEHVFPFLGVRFIAVNDAYDSMANNDRGGNIIVPVLNLINDAYCRDISVKIRSQLEVKRRKGHFIGAFAVFGYLRDGTNKNKLVIDETAADVVKLIYRWKLDGQSAEAIARRLNALKIPSPMAYKKSLGLKYSTSFAKPGKTDWSAVAVFRVLRDETYTGVMVQGKCATPNHKIKKKRAKPVSDWARVDGAHEEIISPEDFNLTARLLERDTRTAPGAEGVYPFSGMAKCGLCGENMIRKTVKASGKSYVYFVCCRGCKGARIAEDSLTGAAAMALQSQIAGILNLDRILRFIGGLPLKQEDVRKLDGQIAARNAEIERCDNLIFSLHESLKTGLITEAEFRMMKARYNALRDDAEQSVISLSREIGEIIANGGEKNQWIERFREYHDFTEITRRMVITLIDAVTVHPGSRLDILFRYRYDYERAVSFAKAACQIHTVPGAEVLKEEVA
jgi:DNA invertase Pin-like site-specific DNA recombinase